MTPSGGASISIASLDSTTFFAGGTGEASSLALSAAGAASAGEAVGFSGSQSLDDEDEEPDSTAASLSGLRGELSGLEQRRDQVRSAWGSDDVADALDGFVDNWDDNRRRISDSMSSLQRMVESTADEFERVEADLTGSFDQ